MRSWRAHAHLGSVERRRHRLGDDDRDAAVVSRHDSDLREGLHRRRLARDVAAARVNAVLERAGLALGRDADGLGLGLGRVDRARGGRGRVFLDDALVGGLRARLCGDVLHEGVLGAARLWARDDTAALGREDRADRMNTRIDRHLGSEERRGFRRKREDDCDSASVAGRHEADLRFVVDVVHDRVVLCKSHHHEG